MRVKIKTPDPKKAADRLKGLIDSSFVSQVNSEVVGEIKRLIRSGQSPVSGFGRFPQYKDRKEYPADRKSATPVNLTLSGKMLAQYGAHLISKTILGIGYDQNTDSHLEGQIIGNNEGTKGIPTRRFIPLSGESFTVSVMIKLKDLYAKRISQLFS